MKRPPGFDRPAVPPTPAARPEGTKPSAGTSAAPGSSRGGTGNRSRRKPVADASPVADATTEPIPVQAAKPAPATAAPGTAFPRAGQASEPEKRQEPTAAATAANARKQLRAAQRARKQYEREEVRRFTWRTRRRRRIWLISLGAGLALIAFVIVGAYSPLMALRTIEVTGSNRIPADQIQAVLSEQLGTPLPLVDFGKVKADLSEFSLIRSYVTESRPPGTLVVRIVEREPVGVIPSEAGFDLVDAAGVVIQSAPERPEGYPTIDARAGVGSPGFQAAAEVVAALPDSIRSQLETVTAATKDDVTLTLAGGSRVLWGSAEKSEYKAVVLGALMVTSPAGSVAEYDVSSPDSAVLR
ncbi:MAG: cell division protein FtsQ [Cryobacterium sp.]|nr:cell division protein FtsQ [Cryobacterium sp.]